MEHYLIDKKRFLDCASLENAREVISIHCQSFLKHYDLAKVRCEITDRSQVILETSLFEKLNCLSDDGVKDLKSLQKEISSLCNRIILAGQEFNIVNERNEDNLQHSLHE